MADPVYEKLQPHDVSNQLGEAAVFTLGPDAGDVDVTNDPDVDDGRLNGPSLSVTFLDDGDYKFRTATGVLRTWTVVAGPTPVYMRVIAFLADGTTNGVRVRIAW